MKQAEHVNIHDPYIALLIRQAEDRAERDACSCVVPESIQREGEALSKRRRYLAELGPRRWDRK
jgi:hypothetical protein